MARHEQHDISRSNTCAGFKGRLLIADSDTVLTDRLGKIFSGRGFTVVTASSAAEVCAILSEGEGTAPGYAILDLRLGRDSGLDMIVKIKESAPECRIVILTAFGSIATAVAAIKSGAIDYLAKPSDADTIENALLQDGEQTLPPPPCEPMTAERVRWEHIQRIHEQCGRNVSETARRLKMHRRTLQRIMAKYAPRDAED